MSEENVEVVRRFIDAMQRSFETYWRNPRSLAEALQTDTLWPEYREALSFLDPEFEWKTVFLEETHRGYLDTAKVWVARALALDDLRLVSVHSKAESGRPSEFPAEHMELVKLCLPAKVWEIEQVA